MSEQNDGRAVGWALRRFAPLLVLVVLLALALSLFVAHTVRRDVGYTATALVIATQLQVRQEQLPRFGESVFNGGSVARSVAATASQEDFRNLVPERISMDPVPDTIAFRVHGHSADPQEAARLANTAAAAFVTQLNKAGAGVGSFSLQDPAFVPLERNVTLVSYPLAGLIGLFGGSTLAATMLALLVGSRRPLLHPEASADAVGAPLLSVVTLPRRGGAPRGMRNLLDVLPTLPSTVVELVGPSGSRRSRRALLAELPTAQQALRSRARPARRRVVVTDLLDQSEVQLSLPAHTAVPEHETLASVVVVVQEGAARRSVVDVVGDFPPEEVAGVVFVRRRRRLRPEAAADPTPPDGQPTAGAPVGAAAAGPGPTAPSPDQGSAAAASAGVERR